MQQQMKIKDKIIHLFGGYTSEEYKKIYAITQMPIPIAKVERNIRTLRTVFRSNKFNGAINVPIEMIKEDLAIKLATSAMAEGLIDFQTKETEDSTYTEANIKIVEPIKEDKYGIF